MVDFILHLDSVTNTDVPQHVLVNSVNNNGGKLGDYSVDASSITFSG